MARILICHVPKDGSTARELGSALMGRGHFVSFDGDPDTPRSDRVARLRQFEAVCVLWTELSVQSGGLADIAREALPLNALVPVRAQELDKSKLPLMFRKLNMLTPNDVDGIARLVARFSTAATSLRNMAASNARPGNERPETGRPETGRGESSEGRKSDKTPAGGGGAAAARPSTSAAAQNPERAARAASPIVEAGAKIKARPLSDLPEVADPFDDPFADPEPVGQAPSTSLPPDRAALRAAVPPDPMAEPPEAPRPAVTAADLARAVDRGLLVAHIPATMWLGEPVTVELSIGRDVLADLFPGEFGASAFQQATNRHGLETLSISLYGHTDVFEIERQSERTQFISPRQAMQVRDPATFGRWTWLVTPQTAGRQDLVVRISALLRDRHGVPEPVALPDRRFEIAVEVPEGADLMPGVMGWHRG